MNHWPTPVERNPTLGHRCYERSAVGVMRYNPPRQRRAQPWTACIELPETLGQDERARFYQRHGMILEPPEFGVHMSVFKGPCDFTPRLQSVWGHLEGESFTVQLTTEMFWKGRSVWVNAYCPEYFLLRETLAGLDCVDNQLWGHVTIGTFPIHQELPPFLDYRDLADWGFRP